MLEDQTFDLKVGEVTAPIRTRQGFVILKVTEHQDAGVPPLKDVEPQIQEAMYMQQMQPALRAYLTKLREDAYIEIKDGFVDSGASPRQTRPVYTAYAPPVVKKKKVEEKRRFERGGRYATSRTAAKPAVTPVAAADRHRKPARVAASECGSHGQGCEHREAEEDQAREDPVRTGSAEFAAGRAGGGRLREAIREQERLRLR